VATKEFVISNPSASVDRGFTVGRIEWHLGNANITKVEAKLASGQATFNGKLIAKGDDQNPLGWVSGVPAGTFTEDFRKPLWHLRADDLAHLGGGGDLSDWYSFGADENGVLARFAPPSNGQRPTYQTSTGPGSLAGIEFVTGDDDILVQIAGTETLAYDADFTAFVVLGDFNSGNNRPIMGTSDTTNTSWQSSWGHKGGDLRVRTDDGDEYNDGSLDLGSDEIRCLVCQNQSATASRMSEYVDGTSLYTSQSITVASSGGWTFNAIGGTERDRNGSPQQRLYSGSLSEIILFDRALTTDQREAYEGMLAHRWGLTSTLATLHTYKVLNPYVGVGIDADSTYLNSLTHITLGTTYTTCSSSTNAIVNQGTITLYLPQAQNPGELTVQITYTAT
jgi:hypothetical protein